jgi:hypothetical protein
VAIPALRKARLAAQSAGALSALRTVVTAQHTYRLQNKVYGTLADLAPQGTLDVSLRTGRKSSHLFTIALGARAESFTCTATPEEDPASMPHYFTDESGVIRINVGAPADITSPPIPR